MSALGTLALVLAAVWMGALSITVALLVRQVALLTHHVDPDYALDGLPVGRKLPQSLIHMLPEGSGSVLVLGADCEPCKQLVHDLRGATFARPSVVVIEGEEKSAAALAVELAVELRCLVGDEAATAYAALRLNTTPFVFLVDQGEIKEKAVPRGAAYLLGLLGQSEKSARTDLQMLAMEK